MSEEIANPSVKVTGDVQGLLQALRSGKTSLGDFTQFLETTVANKLSASERAVQRYERAIAQLGNELRGNNATAQLGMLAAAVDKLGGIEKLTAVQTENLANRIKALAAAGGTVPASLQGLTREVASLDTALKGQGIREMQVLGGRLGPLGSVLQGLGPGGMAAAAGIGATALAAGLFVRTIDKAGAWADNIKDTAGALGESVEGVQRLEAAANAAEVPVEAVTSAVLKMQRAMVDSPEKFQALGFSMEQLGAMAPTDQLAAVAEKLVQIEDPAIRNQMAIALLGKSWAEISPLILGGLDAMKSATVVSSDTVDKLDKLHSHTVMLAESWNKLWIAMGASVGKSPMVVGAIDAITAAMQRMASDLNQGKVSARFTSASGFGEWAADRWQQTKAAYGFGEPAPATTPVPLNRNEADRKRLEAEALNRNLDAQTQMDALASTFERAGGKDYSHIIDQWRELEKQGAALPAVFKKVEDGLEAAGKREQEYWDRVTGKAAQKQMDLLEQRFKRDPVAIQSNSRAYVELIETWRNLEEQGAKLPKVFQDIEDASKRGANMGPETGSQILKRVLAAQGLTPFGPYNLLPPMGGDLLTSRAPTNRQQALAQGIALPELDRYLDPSRGLWTSSQDVVDAEAEIAARDAAPKIKQAANEQAKFNEILAAGADLAQLLGQNLQDGLGRGIASLTIAAAAGERMQHAFQHDEHGNVIGFDLGLGALAALGGAGSVINATGTRGRGNRILGGAGAGATFGLNASEGVKDPLAKGLIVGGSTIVGAIVGAVRGDPGWARAMQEVGRHFGVEISKGLAEQIDADSKKTHDRFAAVLLNLSDVIQEAGGMDKFGVQNATSATRDLFVAIERGTLNLDQAGESFDKVFGDVAAANISKTTGMASAQLRELVALAQTFQIKSPALDAYMRTQADAMIGNLGSALAPMKGLRDTLGGNAGRDAERETRNRLKDSGLSDEEIAARVRRAGDAAAGAAAGAVGIVSQNAASALGASVAASFDMYLEQGLSRSEAMEKVMPVVQSLREELTAAGFEGGAAFAQLDQWVDLAAGEITGPLLSGLSGTVGVMVNMSNTNRLTQSTFLGLTEQVYGTVDALRLQGVEGPALISAIAPDLQKIWELQQQYHFEVSASTQELINQGVTAGAIGEAHMSAADKTAAASERTAAALEYLAGRYGYLSDEADRAMRDRSANATLNIQTNYITQGAPPPGSATSDSSTAENDYGSNSFAWGSKGLRNFGSGTPAMLHGIEAVLREDQLDNLTRNTFNAGTLAALMQLPSADVGASVGRMASGSATATGSDGRVAATVTIGEVTIHVHDVGDPEATAAAMVYALRNNVDGALNAALRESVTGIR